MELASIDEVTTLIAHGKRIKAGISVVKRSLASHRSGVLKQKDVNEAFKFLQSGKKVSDSKFPHVNRESLKKLQELVTSPYLILRHMYGFFMFSSKTMNGAYPFVSFFDLQSNYNLTIKFLELFNIHCCLYHTLASIPELYKVVTLYQLLYHDKAEEVAILQDFLKNRETKYHPQKEFQGFLSRLASFIAHISPKIIDVLKIDKKWKWTKLSLSNPPSPCSKHSYFFKSEYLIMMNLDLLTECVLYIAAASESLLDLDPALSKLYSLVWHYKSCLFVNDSIINDVVLPKPGFGNTQSEDLQQIRQFRRRKLTGILRDNIYMAKINVSHLILNIHTVLPTLGLAFFEISTNLRSSLHNGHLKIIDESFSSLLRATIDLIFILFREEEKIRRFFLFNLKEFDAPMLVYLIDSMKIPVFHFSNATTLISALNLLDIERFDQGIDYDLRALQMAFNRLSLSLTELGAVQHMKNVFQIISQTSFHLSMFNHMRQTILDICGIHTLWGYNSVLLGMTKAPHCDPIGAMSICHFYSYDVEAYSEYPDFKRMSVQYFETVARSLRDRVSASALACIDDIKNYDRLQDLIESIVNCGIISVCGQKKNVVSEVNILTSSFIVQLLSQTDAIPPSQMLEKIGAAKQVIRFVASALKTGCSTVVFDGLYELSSALLSFDNDCAQISEPIGHFPHIYAEFYRKFCRENIKKCMFSLIYNSFVPTPQLPDKLLPANYASPAAFRSIYQFLGPHGCAVLDIVCIEVVCELFEQISDILAPYLSMEDKKMPFKEDPARYSQASTILTYFCQIGSILKLRSSLKNTIDIDVASNPGYSFFAKGVPPHKDSALISRLQVSRIRPIFASSFFSDLLVSIFASSAWSHVKYDVTNDSMNNNSHLIALTFDSVYGLELFANPDFDIKESYCSILSSMKSGISLGSYSHKDSNPPYPTLMMFIIIDKFVDISTYADYSMLELAIPYQSIRSVYTYLIRNYNRRLQAATNK